MKRREKILFVLKERFYESSKLCYGLINSASHVAQYLESKDYHCHLVSVIDANYIDKEIHKLKPDIVIIEALWVPAAKLKELIEMRRYRHIKWVVRVHSDIGFLSAEPMGVENINNYINLYKNNLFIGLNNKKFNTYLSDVLNYKLLYLPNIITENPDPKHHHDEMDEKDHVDIACFGSLRLLKNQCFQAICAIAAADTIGKRLHFHITRDKDHLLNPVLKNLRQLFKVTHHALVEHDWLDNDEFQNLVRKMDFGLQLSYTESFNIVSADFVNNNKLILVSESIEWMPDKLKTSTVDYDIVTANIIALYRNRHNNYLKGFCRRFLTQYNHGAKREWKNFLELISHEQSH